MHQCLNRHHNCKQLQVCLVMCQFQEQLLPCFVAFHAKVTIHIQIPCDTCMKAICAVFLLSCTSFYLTYYSTSYLRPQHNLGMDEQFQVIKPEEIQDNVFQLINNDWMLVCAGTPEHYNMMTASWGGAGFLWKKHIAMIFIRPQRHTFLFIEENPYFTICFFDHSYRQILNYCGTYSGKDVNKMNLKGLDSIVTPNGNVVFKQARLVLECRKIYQDDIRPDQFLSFDQEKIYANKDYHRFYIGEITHVWKAR